MEKPPRDGQKWGANKTTSYSSNGQGRQRTTSSGPTKDELGQIDDIIGNFGRYQFLIFLFKILIG